MSDILPALRTFLGATSAITALVSTRIYPEKLPAGTSTNPTPMPAVVYQLIDEPVITTHGNEQLFRARVQVDSWGGSYKSAHTLAAALHTALHGYRGLMGTVAVGGVFRQAKRDDPDPETGLHRVIQDFFIHYA